MKSSDIFLSTLQKYCKSVGFNLNEEKVESDLKINNEKPDTSEDYNVITKSHDLEKKITVEIIAEPEIPDNHGNWYSKNTIEKGYNSFDKAWKDGRLSMNLFHSWDDKDAENVELLKHYVVPFDCAVPNPRTGESTLVKEGTWMAEVKWKNDALWDKRTKVREDGTTEIGGLSIRGWGKIQEPETTEIEKATTSDVKRDDKGNLVYRGQKFPGYNKPMKDSGDKQGKVLAKKGDQIKVVRFGDPSLPDNQSTEQNDQFYARFGNQKGMDDKFSALYWSSSWLWPRGKLKGKGAKEFYKLKT